MTDFDDDVLAEVRASLVPLNKEVERLRDLTTEIDGVLRIVDAHRLLASLDDRMAGLLEEARLLQQTRSRVNDLATLLENERAATSPGADLKKVLPYVAVFFVVQTVLLVVLQKVL